jgi:MFS family permease
VGQLATGGTLGIERNPAGFAGWPEPYVGRLSRTEFYEGLAVKFRRPTRCAPSGNEEVKSANSAVVAEHALQSSPAFLAYSDWQRWLFLVLLFLVVASSNFDFYVFSILMEPIKKEFAVSDTALGIVSGVCSAALYAIASIPLARWADTGNRRIILTLAVTGWSLMTVLCGLTRMYWQLALARLGVGLAEAGGSPTSQSLITDYFPTRTRATALSILTMGGSSVGWLAGVGIGGHIAAARGWRSAFLVAGLSGLVLAAAVYLLLPEPRMNGACKEVPVSESRAVRESLQASFKVLWLKISFRWILCAMSVYAVFAYGVTQFLPSFMIRSLHASLPYVSSVWGATIACANLVGAVGGGWLTDRLSRNGARWYAWFPALTFVLGAPFYVLALRAPTLSSFVIADFLAESIVSAGIPICFVAIHAICGSPRRALAIATAQFFFMLLGSGFGPVLSGFLSDLLSSHYGAEGLRYALLTMVILLLPAAWALYRSGKFMRREAEP